jgi:hypothetical protein
VKKKLHSEIAKIQFICEKESERAEEKKGRQELL